MKPKTKAQTIPRHDQRREKQQPVFGFYGQQALTSLAGLVHIMAIRSSLV
jgi:hypothetical protein